VVDDDRILTTMFARLLAGVGKVVTANSGADGLALARSVMPDLILLDVQMPGQDGFDTIAELKTDPMVRHIPVIFITADTLPEIESHCLESGAADYIAKPVNPRVLQARARTHLLLKAQADMLAQLDTKRINAIILLSDGKNEYPPDTDLDSLLEQLEGESVDTSVRVFTIGYGEGAAPEALTAIAEASRGTYYEANDPTSIEKVLTSVLSNF
jgi:CheY-like chemotaxis protein